MQANLEVGIAYGLKQPNLASLECDDPAHYHTDQKRRDPEKDRRQDRRHCAQLFDLCVNKAVRRVQIPPVSPQTAIRIKQAVYSINDIHGLRPCRQR